MGKEKGKRTVFSEEEEGEEGNRNELLQKRAKDYVNKKDAVKSKQGKGHIVVIRPEPKEGEEIVDREKYNEYNDAIDHHSDEQQKAKKKLDEILGDLFVVEASKTDPNNPLSVEGDEGGDEDGGFKLLKTSVPAKKVVSEKNATKTAKTKKRYVSSDSDSESEDENMKKILSVVVDASWVYESSKNANFTPVKSTEEKEEGGKVEHVVEPPKGIDAKKKEKKKREKSNDYSHSDGNHKKQKS